MRLRPPRGALYFVLSFLAIFLAGSSYLYLNCGLDGCPDVETLDAFVPEKATVLLDRDGREFARLHPLDREVVRLDSLPPHVPHAFIAIEDQRFREHSGVDLRRMLGALWANIRSMGVEEGASTITMQAARTLFPDRLPVRSRTVWRKLGEARVARELERRYTKDEILELYLNNVYFGEGAWGIGSAAREYFGVSATQLGAAQAALLAGVLRSPSRLNPRADSSAAHQRRDRVLTSMAEQEYLAAETAERAISSDVALAPDIPTSAPALAPYFVDAVRRQLESQLGEDLYTQGYRVRTTLWRTAQEIAQTELERQLTDVEAGRWGPTGAPSLAATLSDSAREAGRSRTPYLQGALVLSDPRTGEVLALVGGRDYEDSPFNRATDARRPVGSAFKPLVYAAALSAGVPLTATLEDRPTTFLVDEGRDRWSPDNYGGYYAGTVTARAALTHSLNVATVDLARRVGLARIEEVARRAGFDGRMQSFPSLVLGTAETSPLDLAGVYGTFATLGTGYEPTLVLAVRDDEGERVWGAPPSGDGEMSPGVAYLIVDILEDVVDRGTARSVRASGYQGVMAGKTGTTNEGADAWFVGFTPDLVGVVWMGHDRPRPIVSGRTSGGELAAPVVARVFARVNAGRAGWQPPPGVERRPVDSSGYVRPSSCMSEAGRDEWFLSGAIPQRGCPRGLPSAGDGMFPPSPPGDGRTMTPAGADTLRIAPPRPSRPRLHDRFRVEETRGEVDSLSTRPHAPPRPEPIDSVSPPTPENRERTTLPLPSPPRPDSATR